MGEISLEAGPPLSFVGGSEQWGPVCDPAPPPARGGGPLALGPPTEVLFSKAYK